VGWVIRWTPDWYVGSSIWLVASIETCSLAHGIYQVHPYQPDVPRHDVHPRTFHVTDGMGGRDERRETAAEGVSGAQEILKIGLDLACIGRRLLSGGYGE
jgi:hypothetical protein